MSMKHYFHGWIKERKNMINKMKIVYFLKADKYVIVRRFLDHINNVPFSQKARLDGNKL